jgi:hypothetical protein
MKPKLGKDAPMEEGGLQSLAVGRFDLIPGKALMSLARVLEEGARKYGVNQWRRIPYESHINHALQHLAAILADDASDEHLEHALTRLALAVAVKSDYKFTYVASQKFLPTMNNLMHCTLCSLGRDRHERTESGYFCPMNPRNA